MNKWVITIIGLFCLSIGLIYGFYLGLNEGIKKATITYITVNTTMNTDELIDQRYIDGSGWEFIDGGNMTSDNDTFIIYHEKISY